MTNSPSEQPPSPAPRPATYSRPGGSPQEFARTANGAAVVVSVVAWFGGIAGIVGAIVYATQTGACDQFDSCSHPYVGAAIVWIAAIIVWSAFTIMLASYIRMRAAEVLAKPSEPPA